MGLVRTIDAPLAGDERIHLVTIDWVRGKWSGVPGKYSREHLWHFAGKLNLKVTDALAPMAYRDAVRPDPLKSYVATIPPSATRTSRPIPSISRSHSRSVHGPRPAQ